MKKFQIKKLIILIIKIYRKFISPFLVPSCRFTPSCSKYAILSIEKFGFVKGAFYSIKRISKCQPFFNKSNFDPVP